MKVHVKSAYRPKTLRYPCIEKELDRLGLAHWKIAKIIGINDNTLRYRLTGRADWRLSEMLKLRQLIGCDIPLDELFAAVPYEEVTNESV